jgi:hypothetical protein
MACPSSGRQHFDLTNVFIDNITVIGSATSTGTNRSGTGVLLQGIQATGAVGVIYNFKSFNAFYLNVGLEYGPYVQGVSVVAGNFQSNNYGIMVQSTAL